MGEEHNRELGGRALWATVATASVLFVIGAALALAWAPTALADKPPGTCPPTVDGLIDDYCYIYVGETVYPQTPGEKYQYTETISYDPLIYRCYYLLAVNPAFNDNVFDSDAYTGQFGWTHGHTFRDLWASDMATFVGPIPSCTFTLDYIDGYGHSIGDWCSGTCGDAYVQDPLGCADGKVEAATSMYYNIVSTTYSTKQGWDDGPPPDMRDWQSPGITYNYTNTETPEDYYEWQMIYEFSVTSTTGCASLIIADAHNSPAKEGQTEDYIGHLGNFVWYDDDKDGVQDEGEEGLAGVALDLYKGNWNETAEEWEWEYIRTTWTNSQGIYWFNYLDSGYYYVDVVGTSVADEYCHTLSSQADIDNDMGSMRDPDGTYPRVCGGTGTGQGDRHFITETLTTWTDTYTIYPMADFGYWDDPTAISHGGLKARSGSDVGSSLAWIMGLLGLAMVASVGVLWAKGRLV